MARQVEDDEEDVQASPLVRRQDAEEEEVQAKTLVNRPESEEEEIQPSSVLQRQESEEEETVQTKKNEPGTVKLKQNQVNENEEEGEIQTTLNGESSDTVQNQSESNEEEETLQPKDNSGSSSDIKPETEAKIMSQKGGGQPLSDSTRAFFEPRFGNDFSNVRVHTDHKADESSKSINAQAYTSGNEIVFSQGQYSPNTKSGKSLLAHELTHIVQQKGAPIHKGNMKLLSHFSSKNDETSMQYQLLGEKESRQSYDEEERIEQMSEQISPKNISLKPYLLIHRKLNVNNELWTKRNYVRKLQKAMKRRIISNQEYRNIIKNKNLKFILLNLIKSGENDFSNERDLYKHLSRRSFTLEGMRMATKGLSGKKLTKTMWESMCCGYAGGISKRKKYKSLARQYGISFKNFRINNCGQGQAKCLYSTVNKAVRDKWEKKGEFEHRLKDEAIRKGEAAEAVENLFKPQKFKKDRNLMDCAHTIAAIHLRAYVKSKTPERFNKLAKLILTRNEHISINPDPGYLEKLGVKLEKVERKGIIPGDHVYFSNHRAYACLLAYETYLEHKAKAENKPFRKPPCGKIYSGEHAVYIGNGYYSGHGIKRFNEKFIRREFWKQLVCHIKWFKDKGINTLPRAREYFPSLEAIERATNLSADDKKSIKMDIRNCNKFEGLKISSIREADIPGLTKNVQRP